MKKQTIEAQTKNPDGPGTISAKSEVEVFESLKELTTVLTSKDISRGLKDRILSDLNRQMVTDALNKMRQELKPVSDKTLLVRGLKEGTIPASEVAAMLKRLGLK